jgi:DNA polymerase III subunit gamma/tau
MSYLVLARKKRPQVFEDVIGQRPITQTLQNAIAQKRVAHAFLFTGPRGVGKTSTARILAKALNCEKGPQMNPCNQCPACKEISEGNSIDVIEIDGASNRGIDEVRELRENVRYTPAKSRYKIIIIDEIHMLTLPAFNALLKTLEEPPLHIVFIFATTEPHKIPATILSRCQRYDFKRIPSGEIVQHLRRIVDEEKIEVSQRALSTLARESEGSMRDAQSLLDRLISYGGAKIRDEEVIEILGLIDQKILSDTIEAIADHDAGRCMEIVEQIYQFGYDIQRFCQELLQYLRNLILLKVSSRPELFLELPDEEILSLKGQAEKFQFDRLNQLFSFLLKGEEEVAQSTFPRTMVEMALIRMAMLRPLRPIDEIIKKLEELGKTEIAAGKRETTEIPPLKKIAKPDPEQKEGKREEDDRRLKEERKENREKKVFVEEPSDDQDKLPVAPREDAGDSEGSQERETFDKDSGEVKEEVWKGLVDFVRARKPGLGSSLILGELVDLNQDRIEIGFEKDSFAYETMIERERRTQLEELCRDFLKREVKVIISSLEGDSRPGGQRISGRRENNPVDEKEVPEKGMEEHPLIQEALRLFDGKIVKG